MTNYLMTNKPIIKMKYLFLIIISILTISCNADTLTVKQDGTGDYTIIQNAINVAVNGDTVLVWPGTYYENIDFIGKNITLASLMLTTGDESYKYSTIIDGNNNGSCVVFMTGETDAVLYGFTLQHGSGTNWPHPVLHYGGGIFITYSSCSIMNCVISNNHVDGKGGGVFCSYSANLYISQTSIIRNQADGSGGGIMLGYESTIQFDSVYLCNIYLNYSDKGCDFHKVNNDSLVLYLDTCTVQQPDNYFVISSDQSQYSLNDITTNIQNHIITPKDADLYVNPQTGDNNNSGLTPNDPLKTIAFAYSSIVVDSLEKNTIHLANGIYSDSANNEKFPLNIRPYINVTGESRNNTILDGMYKSRIIKGNSEVSNFSFRKMTMQRGGHIYYDHTSFSTPAGFALLYAQNHNIIFDSIVFKNGQGYPYMGNFTVYASNNVLVKNCEFRDNIGAYAIRTGADAGDTITISNCIFSNNMPDYQQQDLIGGALSLHSFNTSIIVQGCLFTGNNNYNTGLFASFTTDNNYFINCTFTENTLNSNYVSIGVNDVNLLMYNCILYNEGSLKPISLKWYEATDTISLEIYNSLIEGGIESIYVEPGLTRLHYDETNIDADPLFYGGFEYPYNLSDLSPCIDAGTLDLPERIELPETDLAGNPRIYGETIDMGAYEWNPTVGIDEYSPIKNEKENLLKAAPNPFSGSTTITVRFTTKANIKLEIYNNYGQRIKVLMDCSILPGTSRLVWHGDNQKGKQLQNGVYHIVMFENGEEIDNIKVIISD